MCGIIAYHKKSGLGKRELSTALDCLAKIEHRGPDGEGVVLIDSKTGNYQLLKTKDTPIDVTTNILFENYIDGSADIFLAQRRLSIIELSAQGFQPMKDEVGNWIIFNGEIYNYIEIKKELQLNGYLFKTNSDTEVILKAYNAYGVECLSRFNGMWSIIIWDNNSNFLFVSNDRYGVKPLYLYENKEEFLYASEIKAFYPLNKATTSINNLTVELFLNDGILDSSNNTLFTNINRFPCSHFKLIHFKNYSYQLIQYWFNNIEIDYSITNEKAIEEFNFILKNAIDIRLRADVDVGVAVSGGLDSSVLCYYANEILKSKSTNTSLKSFSVIFPDQEGDESYFSKYIVNDLKLNAKFVNPFDDFSMSEMEKLTYQLDAPMQSTAFYASWSLMRLVSNNNVKVLLEGQGADELFGGYHHHFYKYCRELILKGKIRSYIRETEAFSKFKNRPISEIHKIIINDVKLFLKLKLGLSNVNLRTEYFELFDVLEEDFSKNMLPSYLRLDDRTSMAFGVESRLPFMDFRLVNFAKKIPSSFKINNGIQKNIIREASSTLPNLIRYRKDKKGFTTPQSYWMKTYKEDFMNYIDYLKILNLDFKNSEDENLVFRQYALAIWLKQISNIL